MEGNWRPQFIIEVIEFFLQITFHLHSSSNSLKNNRSALAEASFVEEAIRNLLELNCTAELSVPPDTKSIQKNSKKRLILDLRHINLHLFNYKFKREDIAVAKEVI